MVFSDFLNTVLGSAGTQALLSSAKKLPQIEKIYVPQVLISWIRNNAEYNSTIPGVADSSLVLKKTDKDIYSGLIKSDSFEYEFDNASIAKVVAVIGYAFGIKDFDISELGKVDLVRFSSNIEALVKSRNITQETTIKIFKHQLSACKTCLKILPGCSCNKPINKSEPLIKEYPSYLTIRFKDWEEKAINDFIKAAKKG